MNDRVLARLRTLVVACLVVATATVGAAKRPGTLRGVVIDEASHPLEGVRITVTSASLPEPIESRTGADGSFVIELPNVKLTYTVQYELEGHQEFAHDVDAREMQDASLEVRLPGLEAAATSASAGMKQDTGGQAEAPSEERHAAILLFNEGVEALHADDLDTANAKFHAAMEADPSFPEPYRALSATAGEVEDWAAAAKWAEELLRLEPNNIQAMNTVYFGDLMTGDVDAAKAAAGRLAATNPDSLAQILDHAKTFFDNNDFGMARALLEVYTTADPDQPDPYFSLGVSCNALGDPDAARAAFARFLELAPPDHPDRATAEEMLAFLK